MPPISVPQTTFKAFSEEYPLLISKLLRWANQSMLSFPEDPSYVYSRRTEEFVERYVTEFLVAPPKTEAEGAALLGAWNSHLSAKERQQISRLFGETLELPSPNTWYTDPRDNYLVLTEPVLELLGKVGGDNFGAITLKVPHTYASSPQAD
jgi:hypothetical protein